MKILVLSPHTDDAELGCGGTIVKQLENGNEIFWMVFSTAEESLSTDFSKDTLKKEYYNVITELNLNDDNCQIFDFKVRNLHRYRQDILESLVKIKNEFRPQLVMGPSLNDVHQDHQVVANEMVRAFKTTTSIICYELPWNHITFNTQMFSILNKSHIDRKFKILNNYKSQIDKGKPYFSKEFIYGLASARGVQCNSDCAEAFEVVRWIL